MASSLTIGALIGSGAYGSVYHARWATRRVAIKKFNVGLQEVQLDTEIQQEIQMLRRLQDRHIIQFYGITYHEDKLVLVMDYAEGGSLQGAIKKRVLSWTTKRRIALEMARGLAYIHHEGVLHRDLKSGNVLLTRYMEVKLCDFGMATVKVTSGSKSSTNANNSGHGREVLKGTFRWMAPELFAARPKYSAKSDIYAFAIVMWEMAADCTVPFKEQLDNFMVMALVKGGEREEFPDDTPPDYRQWVEQCWTQDPAQRPNASDLVTMMEENEQGGEQHHQLQLLQTPNMHIENVGMDDLGGAAAVLSAVSITDEMAVAPPSAASIVEEVETVQSNVVEPLLPALVTIPTTSSSFERTLVAHQVFVENSSSSSSSTSNGNSKSGESSSESRQPIPTPPSHDPQQLPNSLVNSVVVPNSEADHHVDLEAQMALAVRYDEGQGVEQSVTQAFQCYLRAAEAGHAGAQYCVGQRWFFGGGGAPRQDYSQAAAWFRKAAKQGLASAQAELGFMYRNGIGVEYDTAEALMWYMRAAEKQHPSAQYNVGFMYQNGIGLEQNYQEAIGWYRKAATQGHTEAQITLGMLYSMGIGNAIQDYAQSAVWYRKAAENGSAVGQYHLGWMYEHGRGVSKDLEQAIQWYRRAAALGHITAKDRLANLIES
ncbi:hypothetical protein BGW41_004326 [Actinomortierella wolfii]|nr:hypothetical protein BGW41_004326 [Actinomortierella wolfii]